MGGVKRLGEAIVDVWAFGAMKGYRKDQHTWIFSKIVKEPHGSIVVKVWDKNGTCSKYDVKIEKIDTIPEQFTSTIGTKNGITVNEDEAEFCEKQRACGMKPNIRLVHIESSSLCNLKCQYCVVSNNYNRIERGIISDKVLDAAIVSVNEMPEINTIQVSGLGEPLTNPEFCNMCWRIYKETHVRNVWFFSNGMLLTKEISEELAKIPLNFKIFFSIDGKTPEENGIQRRGSVYSIVKENILYFLKQIEGKKNFRVKIHNLIVTQEDDKIHTPEFLLNDFGFIGIDTHRAFYFPELSKEELHRQKIEIHQKPNKKVCKRMFGQATIRSNGDVIRCHWDSTCSVVMGNILDASLKKIWWGEKYVELRRKMMPEVPLEELPEACQKCHAMNEGYLYKD